MTYLLKALDLLRDAYATRDWEGVKKARDMIANDIYKDIHTCSYYCMRPNCISAQRDELRDKYLEEK